MAPWWLRTKDDEVLADEGRQAVAPESTTEEAVVPESVEEESPAQGRPSPPAQAMADSEAGDEEAAVPAPLKTELERAREDAGREPISQEPSGEEPAVLEPDALERPRRRKRRRRRRSGPRGAAVEAAKATEPQDGGGAREERAEPSGEPFLPKEVASPSTAKEPKGGKSAAARPVMESFAERPRTFGAVGSATGLEREIVFTLPERQSFQDERKIAMFCDFENIALGVRASEIKKLDINMVLARLLEKGKIIVKKAYADWERYSEAKRRFHEAAIELIDIPQKSYSGKNSADIKMVVDAMDLCYSKEHLDTFVILSGDSDFSPLVSKLKENNKYVIGIGVKNSSSSLLIDNCDEFIYYEDVWRASQQKPGLDRLLPKEAEVFGLMSDAMLALIRENKGVLWGSMIKQTMQRMRPSFSESYYGYSTFSELLEDAARKNVIGLERDQRSGNYVVTGFIPGR